MPPSSPAHPLPVFFESSQHPSSPLHALADVFRPRKSRMRATIVCLFSLVALSIYIFLVAQPSLTVAPLPLRRKSTDDLNGTWRNLAASYAAKYRDATVAFARPQVSLTTSQELAALTSFMAALPQNVIPLSVDPSEPIDPQLILDFDTRSVGAEDEVEQVVRDAWHRNPVVIFSKMRSPVSRELKTIIDSLYLRPTPAVFDVDQRDDAAVLVPLLHRLTAVDSLPILLIGGVPVGSIEDVRELDASGQLRRLITAAGAEIDGGRKKKKGRAH
ncbi:hypothetical protein OF83DRAFT_1200866 [Amylostereum chailletii]|nr:hypothetical protein OF83DRAFT_1200866 [Amylostereum chailletii]